MDPDLTDLLAAWVGDDVPADRRAAVLARLRDDPAFRTEAVDELRMVAMLKVLRGGEPRWLRLEDELGWSADEPADDFAASVAAEVATLPLPERAPAPVRTRRRRLRPVATLAASVLVAAGVVAAVTLYRGDSDGPTRQPAADAVALLVRLDGPGWLDGNGPAAGEVIRPGVLSLGGGSATLALFNGVTLHIEGPAEVDVQSADRVFCRRGKVRIDAPSEVTGFLAQAPGATVADPAAEFALTVGADDRSDVAVFAGQADVAVLDRQGRAVGRETLTVGQTVRVDARVGRITTEARAAGDFAGPIPPLDSLLRLSPGYAAAVRADGAAAYWRFETAADGLTPNELPDAPALKLIGKAAPAGPAANRGLHFPPPTEWEQHGALAVGPLPPAKRDYAVECWVMPRAVRQASLVGLAAETDSPRVDGYGVLLELTGQPALFRHPARSIRALHRLPVGRGRGANQFSPTPYLPYRWYHVLAQRAGDRLELYIDGELATVGPPEGTLPPGCRVLLGALYASRDGAACSERPFVGALDEVAVYARALSPAAVRRHFQLGRGGGEEGPSTIALP
jgi:hypothetical protein